MKHCISFSCFDLGTNSSWIDCNRKLVIQNKYGLKRFLFKGGVKSCKGMKSGDFYASKVGYF